MTDFLSLHRPGDPLLMPNAFDVGSARVLAGAGFQAIATTSGGYAATLGRGDGEVTRDEAVGHGGALAAAVGVPVSADLEDGFGDSPDEVAATITAAREAGLAGCSIEDYTRDDDNPVHDLALARDRVAAAVEASGGPGTLVVTARADGHLHGHTDLGETVARLQAFQEAGAHVLYAPGLRTLEEVGTVCAEVDRPVNVLLLQGGPTPAEIADAGAARISVGGAWTWVAYSGLVDAARELLAGSASYFDRIGPAYDAFTRGGR
ncbi:isocitrate lyase/phosphoenolpyruvate mutase family protein [Nocardioides panacisoli]|uniref:Isocitrate lyase/phosphoenolpyruvate mutase family protein n=1 Tax=Nocardioides panacisoli TaxID=627624 RepID=A0ABP7HT95_9ACTN